MTMIYLDNHSTTPVDPRVLEVMLPYFCKDYGNASSNVHAFGWQAEAAVKKAREQVASLIHAADPKEILWTSGTTESINMALRGVAALYQDKGNHIISCVTEHPAVLETLHSLERQGFQITLLPVNASGLLDPSAVEKAIHEKTILISLMAAHNEIGVLHPLGAIGKIAKARGVLFHVDAAQACGKIPLDVQEMGIDLMSMSAHKVYGPKGIGALYLRSRKPKVRLAPLIHGGGQENGLRSGTLAVPGIVGMGEAFEIAGREMPTEAPRLLRLRQKLLEGIGVEGVFLNGHPEKRLPGNLNLSFSGVKASDILMRVREIALSSGSACATGSHQPSYVLKALGLSDELAYGSLRFGIGRFNTEAEIEAAIEKIMKAVQYLRRL